ncbi:uncharacterized protein LY79DRAFT_354791 [Colletotrichum navitas]|uniref:Uncharacterized protein n=1 Tax=Colletotrichum navitas TaxID=681940 RepID=A0AAD8Q9Z6_9PEZI|nr:uncharacterized protein LY79DRAFT_354791 [Colletotrichum navitas]KAK1597732.1 hypothetical protein LY79DRAFT_354791 [Colletotrichum navitas]
MWKASASKHVTHARTGRVDGVQSPKKKKKKKKKKRPVYVPRNPDPYTVQSAIPNQASSPSQQPVRRKTQPIECSTFNTSDPLPLVVFNSSSSHTHTLLILLSALLPIVLLTPPPPLPYPLLSLISFLRPPLGRPRIPRALCACCLSCSCVVRVRPKSSYPLCYRNVRARDSVPVSPVRYILSGTLRASDAPPFVLTPSHTLTSHLGQPPPLLPPPTIPRQAATLGRRLEHSTGDSTHWTLVRKALGPHTSTATAPDAGLASTDSTRLNLEGACSRVYNTYIARFQDRHRPRPHAGIRFSLLIGTLHYGPSLTSGKRTHRRRVVSGGSTTPVSSANNLDCHPKLSRRSYSLRQLDIRLPFIRRRFSCSRSIFLLIFSVSTRPLSNA